MQMEWKWGSPLRTREVGTEAECNGVPVGIFQGNESRDLGSGGLGLPPVSIDEEEERSVVAVVWGGSPGWSTGTVVEGTGMTRMER